MAPHPASWKLLGWWQADPPVFWGHDLDHFWGLVVGGFRVWGFSSIHNCHSLKLNPKPLLRSFGPTLSGGQKLVGGFPLPYHLGVTLMGISGE